MWGVMMKKLMQEYKGFVFVICIEILFLLGLVLSGFRESQTVKLDIDNLNIYDPMVIEDRSQKCLWIENIDNSESASTRWMVGAEDLKVAPGMYELEVEYCSELYKEENNGGNYEDKTAIVQLISKSNPSAIVYNELNLYDGKTKVKDRVWIRSLLDVTDLQVVVSYLGSGKISVKSILIKELFIWRITRVVMWLIFFAIGDVAYFYFFTCNKFKNRKAIFIMAASIFCSSLPLFTDFLFWGHDISFHLERILALAQSIEDGNWIMPIQTESLNGYGYATPLFYSPMFLYIPAILYNMALPIQNCYQIYILLINISTCLIAYFCMNSIVKNNNISAVGAFLYTTSAYRIANLYVRAALGEYTAMVFMPLVLYGFLRVYMKSDKKIRFDDCLYIVFGLSGIIQSHILSCEMVALFIVIGCAIAWRRTFKVKRILALAFSAMITIGLNIAFILPFIMSMQMDIRVRNNPINMIQNQGTYLVQVLGFFQSTLGDSVVNMKNEMSLALGFSLVLGLGIFLWCYSQRYIWNIVHNEKMKLGCFCTMMAIFCIIISTRLFPWDSISDINVLLAKVLCMVQFPWRYLSIATVFCSISTVIGLKILAEKKDVKELKVICIVLIVCSVLNVSQFYTDYCNRADVIKVYGEGSINDKGSGGEYLPEGTQIGYLRWRKIITDEESVEISNYVYDKGITSFYCKNISTEEKTVEIPLLFYDNYHAYIDNSKMELNIGKGDNNKIVILIPQQYEGMICVKYEIPNIWKIAYAISGFILILLICYMVYTKNLRGANNEENK